MRAQGGIEVLHSGIPHAGSETPIQDVRELRKSVGVSGHVDRNLAITTSEDASGGTEQSRGSEAQKRNFTTTIVALIGAAATVLGPDTFTAGPGGELLDAARRLCDPRPSSDKLLGPNYSSKSPRPS